MANEFTTPPAGTLTQLSTPSVSDEQITDWFKQNQTADDKTIASTMDQFKLSPADIARATGANLDDIQSRYNAVNPSIEAVGGLEQALNATTSQANNSSSSFFPNWQQEQELRQQDVARRIAENNNVLSGNIMAGASWNSLNPTLADELTQATGQQTYNTALGGATTADTLKQLNDYTNAGGSFAPGSNVFLQTGGLDLVAGLDRDTIQNNIDQIVSRLEEQGVNVFLTGSPYASSFEDVKSNNFNPQLDAIYNNIASRHSNRGVFNRIANVLPTKHLHSHICGNFLRQ